MKTTNSISKNTPPEEQEPQNDHLQAQIEELVNVIKRKDTEIAGLRSRLDDFLKGLYGGKSEKLNTSQLLLDSIILDADKNLSKEEEPLGVIEKEIKAHTRRTHPGRRPLPEHLERVEHYLDIDEKEKTCGCGKPLNYIGDDITERIDYAPASLFVNQYIRPKYACGVCDCEGCGVKQAEAPEGPIDRCGADSGLLAHIIEEKYEHHNPLYRQELRFKKQDIDLSRQTMCDWIMNCAHVLEPLYECIRKTILAHDIVLNDDTPVDMQEKGRGTTRTTRLWCTIGGSDFQYTMYNFTLGRGREGPSEFFKGYKGYFVSDAYAGYDELFRIEEITNVACWTHARRYFKKAQDSSPRAATEILTLIAQLYQIEKEIKGKVPEERCRIRIKKAVPYLDKIKKWLTDHIEEHLPQSLMRKGIDYTLRIWKELNVYTTDGRLPIDNNLAENGIRPIALGRKNWMFVGSEKGGHAAATLMTFCTTCRKNKINTWKYLKDVLQRINTHPMSRIHELLPDQWQESQKIQ